MDRRRFVQCSSRSVTLLAIGMASHRLPSSRSQRQGSCSLLPPAASIEPVVADGRWISKDPPDGETGYFEPRPFSYAAKIELLGKGTAEQVVATTPVPVDFPEQTIDDVDIATVGCSAAIHRIDGGAGQLVLQANAVRRGQRIAATARFRLTLRKDYRGFDASRFPKRQAVSTAAARPFLRSSPGIEVRRSAVRNLARELSRGVDHPWDKARCFHDWSIANITPHVGPYTSVERALKKRRGDCEERAAVFVALCRSAGIPARIVWVPQHNWAEFYLVDHEGHGAWIPSHTAAYLWFGWTGVHELILQKGDQVRVPQKRSVQRLQSDWLQWKGARPKPSFTAELEPLPQTEGGEAGPGARRKDAHGRWHLIRRHEYDRYARNT